MKVPYNKHKRENKKKSRKHRLTPKAAAWIVVITALIAAVAISFGMTGSKTDITLPTGSAPVQNKTAAEKQKFTLSDADITRDNVQQVIADLKRPDGYSMSIKNTVYWDNDWSECQVNMYARDGVFMTEYYNTTQEIERYEIIDGKKYYSWRSGKSKYHTGKTGTVTADQNAMLPTYETIVELDKNDITDAGLRTVNNEPCVYCVVNDKKSGYTINYYVSTVTGLLMQTDYTKNNTLVRSVIMTTYDSNPPTDDKFTLPDGKNVITGLKTNTENNTTDNANTALTQ